MRDISDKLDGISQDHALPHNIWEWLLLPFIVGLMTLSHVEGLSKIMILYGAALGWLFSLYFLYSKIKLQPEVIIFFLWIVWAIVGAFKASDLNIYLEALITIVQIGFLIFVIAGITALHANFAVVLFAIILGGMAVSVTSYYSGELQLAVDVGTRTRVAGVTGNANSFAYHLLFILFALFYFQKTKTSFWWRIFQLALAMLVVLGTIYSGSRKGFLGLLAFVCLWFFFCHRKSIVQRPVVWFAIILLAAVGSYMTIDFVLTETYLGKRFGFESIEHGTESRMQMYVEGFDMIRREPIFGVGLNNYRYLSSVGTYSHSDYIEVASNTGIVGFILYFSIYVILWCRLNRIKGLTNDPKILYMGGVLKAAIVTILLVAFGRPNITSKLTWIFLAGAAGYTWSIERKLTAKKRRHEKDLLYHRSTREGGSRAAAL